jgi:hypothetical protein
VILALLSSLALCSVWCGVGGSLVCGGIIGLVAEYVVL